MDIDALLQNLARIARRRRDDLIRLLENDVGAYNVDDTSNEVPNIACVSDWDEYWKHFTEKNLTNQKCASCGCILNKDTRVGAHIRLFGEPDNTRNAWIALFCKSCNGSTKPQRVRKGSWIVKTTMSKAHKNVLPLGMK